MLLTSLTKWRRNSSGVNPDAFPLPFFDKSPSVVFHYRQACIFFLINSGLLKAVPFMPPRPVKWPLDSLFFFLWGGVVLLCSADIWQIRAKDLIGISQMS